MFYPGNFFRTFTNVDHIFEYLFIIEVYKLELRFVENLSSFKLKLKVGQFDVTFV